MILARGKPHLTSALAQHLQQIVEIIGPNAPVAAYLYGPRRLGNEWLIEQRAVLRDEHPVALARETALGIVDHLHRMEVALVRECLDHGHEVQESIGDMKGDDTVRSHVPQVYRQGFARDEVHGDCVARKRVDGEKIEVLRRLALEVETGVA